MAIQETIQIDDQSQKGLNEHLRNLNALDQTFSRLQRRVLTFGGAVIGIRGAADLVRSSVQRATRTVQELASRGSPAARELVFGFERAKDAFFDIFADPDIQMGMKRLGDWLKNDAAAFFDKLMPKVREMKHEVKESITLWQDLWKRITDNKYRNEPGYQPSEENFKNLQKSIAAASDTILKMGQNNPGVEAIREQLKRDIEARDYMAALLNTKYKAEGKGPFDPTFGDYEKEYEKQKQENIMKQRTAQLKEWMDTLKATAKTQDELDTLKTAQDYHKLGEEMSKYIAQLRELILTKKIDGKKFEEAELALEKQRLQTLIQAHYQRMNMIEKERQAVMIAESDKQRAFQRTGASQRASSMSRFSGGLGGVSAGGFVNPFSGWIGGGNMFGSGIHFGGSPPNRHALNMPNIGGAVGNVWRGLNPNEIERIAKQAVASRLNELKTDIRFSRIFGDSREDIRDLQRQYRETKSRGATRGDLADAANKLAQNQIGLGKERGDFDRQTAENMRKASDIAAQQQRDLEALAKTQAETRAMLDAISKQQRQRAINN